MQCSAVFYRVLQHTYIALTVANSPVLCMGVLQSKTVRGVPSLHTVPCTHTLSTVPLPQARQAGHFPPAQHIYPCTDCRTYTSNHSMQIETHHHLQRHHLITPLYTAPPCCARCRPPLCTHTPQRRVPPRRAVALSLSLAVSVSLSLSRLAFSFSPLASPRASPRVLPRLYITAWLLR